jgi:hypothetical protein
MLFAHLKRILKLDRQRLRGPTGARVMTGQGSEAADRARAGELLVTASR